MVFFGTATTTVVSFFSCLGATRLKLPPLSATEIPEDSTMNSIDNFTCYLILPVVKP